MTAAEQTPLPPDPAFRCSPWTRAHDVDPIGSAGAFDALLLVEWPLPWPPDVSEIPELARASAVPGVRVMAVVPQPDATADGRLTVVHRRRTATNHLAGVDHRVTRAELPQLLDTLVAAPLADHGTLPSVVGDAPSEVLVCGHGRRDACCGRWGTRLHLEVTDRWAGVRVWRCSHTGGHRFAPTAITLPDGRAWAYVEAELLDGVVRRTGDLRVLAAHDRGTTALDPWAQVVERGVFEHVGWPWLDRSLESSSTDVAPDGRSATVTLSWSGGSAVGEVEVTRVLPVLVCGEPPEHAVKSSPELALRDLRIS
jgi:hypothetical protein